MNKSKVRSLAFKVNNLGCLLENNRKYGTESICTLFENKHMLTCEVYMVSLRVFLKTSNVLNMKSNLKKYNTFLVNTVTCSLYFSGYKAMNNVMVVVKINIDVNTFDIQIILIR